MAKQAQPDLELISFKLCPFVQRAVIVLQEKGIDFRISYIDLKNKPDWFLKLSPLGKVPVLKANGTVLFESAVIAEYLDEITPPSLHPADPLVKARNRAWIEYASDLLMLLYQFTQARLPGQCHSLRDDLAERLERLEAQLETGPYFNGADFALVDAAFAPFFMRLALAEEQLPMGLLEGLPKVERWSRALLARPAVRDSVVPEFPDLFAAAIAGSTCLAA